MQKTKIIRVAAVTAALCGALVASSIGQQPGAPGPSSASAQTMPAMASAGERMRLRDGLAAAENGDWGGLANLRDNATDPLVRHMLQWRWAASTEAPLYFDDIRTALNELQGWPGRVTMRNRAEQAIFNSRLSAQERADFLRQDAGPTTGDGRIALAIALKELGQRSEATQMARAAWRDDALTDNAQQRTLDNFQSDISSEDYAARVDGLLWRDQRTEALRLFSHISAADRLLAQGRIALQTRQRRHLQQAVDAVPASRRDNPGFLYDRAQYRRRTDQPVDAMQIAAQIDPIRRRSPRATTSSRNAASTCRAPSAPAIISSPTISSPTTACAQANPSPTRSGCPVGCSCASCISRSAPPSISRI